MSTDLNNKVTCGEIPATEYNLMIKSSLPIYFIIWKDGSVYYRRNAVTGLVTYGSDASTIIQGAIDALPALGAALYFRAGTYEILTMLTAVDNMMFIGEGRNSTILKWTGGAGTIISAPIDRLTIRDLTIDGDNIGGVTGVLCNVVKGDWYFERVRILNCTTAGLDANGNLFDCMFVQCQFYHNGIGMIVEETGFDFYGVIFTTNTIAIKISGTTNGARFFGGVFSQNGTDIQVEGTIQELLFDGVWFEETTSKLINIVGARIIRKLTFDTCHMHIAGAVATFLDLTNMDGCLRMDNCEIPLESVVITLGVNCYACHIDNGTSANQNVVNRPITTLVDNGTDNISYHEIRKNIALGAGVGNYAYVLRRTMPNASYRVVVSPSWNTITWITAKAVGGFTVNFSAVTPDANQTIDVDVIY